MEYNGADFMEYPKHKPVYSRATTIEAIPITDFYRMISNVQLDCSDDDSGFSAEYRDGYSDGTRNAIIEMVQALCGDYDGDCDEFWEKFLKWDDKRRLLEKAEQYERVNAEGSYIIPDGVGGWKRADEKEVNYQYTTDTK